MSERVERLRRLLEKASRGPWTLGGEGRECHRYIGNCIAPAVARMRAHYAKDRKRDGDLICALRNAAPALLKCVEAAKAIDKQMSQSEAMDSDPKWQPIGAYPIDSLRAALRELEREGT